MTRPAGEPAGEPGDSDGEPGGDAVGVPFVPTAEELLAAGLHATRPNWEGLPGRGEKLWLMVAVGLFPPAAGAAALPFEPLTGLALGGFGSLLTAPLLPAALLYRRGGAWLDGVRRRRVARNLSRAHRAAGLAARARTAIFSPAGVAEEVHGDFAFRGWPRAPEVDRVPVPGGRGGQDREPHDGEPIEGELLVIAAVAGGPAPVVVFLPRRAVPGGPAAYAALARQAEAWCDAARGADPADPRWAPPPACRAAPGDAAVRFAPTIADHVAAARAARPRPAPADWGRAGLWLTLAAILPAAAVWLGRLPVGAGLASAAGLGGIVFIWLEARFRAAGWADPGVRGRVRAAVAADPTRIASAVTSVSAAGIRVAGDGFGSAHSWHPAAAVRVAGEPAAGGPFLLLPAATGRLVFVPRRAFETDAAFEAFAAEAERLRTGLAPHAPSGPPSSALIHTDLERTGS